MAVGSTSRKSRLASCPGDACHGASPTARPCCGRSAHGRIGATERARQSTGGSHPQTPASSRGSTIDPYNEVGALVPERTWNHCSFPLPARQAQDPPAPPLHPEGAKRLPQTHRAPRPSTPGSLAAPRQDFRRGNGSQLRSFATQDHAQRGPRSLVCNPRDACYRLRVVASDKSLSSFCLSQSQRQLCLAIADPDFAGHVSVLPAPHAEQGTLPLGVLFALPKHLRRCPSWSSAWSTRIIMIMAPVQATMAKATSSVSRQSAAPGGNPR